MSLNKFLENWAVGCGANQSWKTIPSVHCRYVLMKSTVPTRSLETRERSGEKLM